MTGIVILNYQSWKMTLQCIRSIAGTQKDVQYHIYLVDNASSVPMPYDVGCYIEKHQEQVTFLQSERNRGYSAGNNIGIRQALTDGCEALVIANNDVLFQSGAIRGLIDTLDDKNKIGIAGPKILDKKGRVQPSRCAGRTEIGDVFRLFTAAKLFFGKAYRHYYCLDKNPQEASEAYYVSGCCFAMSRECALAVTPFDEGTVLYYEEQILGIRMEQRGYRTWYQPKSVVIHRQGGTSRNAQPFVQQCISQSELYYCSRYLHARPWQMRLLYYYRRGLYWIRSVFYADYRKYRKKYERETRQWYERYCRK